MPYKYYPATIYDEVLVTDILKKFKFTDAFKRSTLVDTYIIKEEDTPESLAHLLYGDAKLSWIILSLNSMTDRNLDWPFSSLSFDRHIENQYPGSCIFILDEKITFTLSDAKYFVVSNDRYDILSVDRNYNKIRTTTVVPLSVTPNDTINFYDINGILLKQTTIDKVVYEDEFAVHHFEIDEEYADPRNLAAINGATLIKTYILGSSEQYVVRNFTHEININDQKRNIILILPSQKNAVISKIKKLFSQIDKKANILDIAGNITVGDVSE